jgi:hypothetical protein
MGEKVSNGEIETVRKKREKFFCDNCGKITVVNYDPGVGLLRLLWGRNR